MTETSPAPAEEAVGSGTSELKGDEVAPEWFIPPSTRDNYAQIARDQAAIRGVEPKAVMQELAGTWQEMHARQPLDGYDHLAAWGREFDPAAGTAPSGLAVLQARALESARRDPYQAVIGDQSLVAQGVAAQQQADAAVAGATSAPSVDPASGMLPGSGPLPTPDVPVGPDADSSSESSSSESSPPAPPESTSTPPTSGGETPAGSTDSSTASTPPPTTSKSSSSKSSSSSGSSGSSSGDSSTAPS